MVVNSEYTELYEELELLEEHGIDISLAGKQMTALQVVQAHMIKESGTYMRDYVLDSQGHLQVLLFDDIDLDTPHV